MGVAIERRLGLDVLSQLVTVMTDEERARIKAEARATLRRLADFPTKKVDEVPEYQMEDPVAKWKREADERDARFAAERQRARDEERRRLEDRDRRAGQSAVSDMQADLAEALTGIADALGVLDARLQKLESRTAKKKTASTSRPVNLPDFLGPTRSPHDPTVRLSQPRIQ
jgi:hypothetical protein